MGFKLAETKPIEVTYDTVIFAEGEVKEAIVKKIEEINAKPTPLKEGDPEIYSFKYVSKSKITHYSDFFKLEKDGTISDETKNKALEKADTDHLYKDTNKDKNLDFGELLKLNGFTKKHKDKALNDLNFQVLSRNVSPLQAAKIQKAIREIGKDEIFTYAESKLLESLGLTVVIADSPEVTPPNPSATPQTPDTPGRK